MKAVVTGGAGFLGSHLVDRLLAEGYSVVAVDNLITGSRENLAHLSSCSSFSFIDQDVSSALEVEGPLDFVFHFASPASPADFPRYPIEIMKVGSLGTLNALELARRNNAKFMIASTSEVYGDPTISPQPETYWGNVNPNGPRSCYDEAKRFAEALTLSYKRVHGLDVRVLRLFNSYGPRMRLDDGRIVPNFISQALRGEPLTIYGDGKQTRCFGYYADIVDGIWRLACSDFQEPVNVGNDHERTVLDFARAVLKAVGSSSSVMHLAASEDDPRQRQPDLNRARSILGWSPSTTLEDGLAETIAYFREKVNVKTMR
jgi:dTDP-glucose 4,6-dehydratase